MWRCVYGHLMRTAQGGGGGAGESVSRHLMHIVWERAENLCHDVYCIWRGAQLSSNLRCLTLF